MGPIEDSLRESFFPQLFGVEEISAGLREILGHSVKPGGLGIPDHRLLVECVYNTSKAASEVVVGSLLGGNDLNYIAHKWCVRRASVDRRKQWEFLETEVLTRRKDLADRVGLNRLQQAT